MTLISTSKQRRGSYVRFHAYYEFEKNTAYPSRCPKQFFSRKTSSGAVGSSTQWECARIPKTTKGSRTRRIQQMPRNCDNMQCIACTSNDIPRFAERPEKIYDILESAYRKVGRRTKKVITKLNVHELGWGMAEF